MAAPRSRSELPIDSGLTASQARYSQIDRIQTEGGDHEPRFEIFGGEPPQGWCYYFERADLARQRKDWQQVVKLADESQALNFRPGDSIEWLPFLEGYLRMNNPDKFTKLAKNNQVPVALVCTLLDRMAAEPASVSELGGLRPTFSCWP
jgi:hypothetical protein